MNKIYKQHLFLGERYLNKSVSYFEGWYFKITSSDLSIAFIPGIQVNQKGGKAFIQVITNDKSYHVDYDLESFSFSHQPFYVRIGSNYFSNELIKLDLPNIPLKGTIAFSNGKNISSTLLKPNIMGPFSYLPFMECYHSILQMKGEVNGNIQLGNKDYSILKGISYIEKDWGTSFPESYLWIQANTFNQENVSFMLSIAQIPLFKTNFTGLICALMIGKKEYRFATYNNTIIINYEIINEKLYVTIKKGCLMLSLDALLTSKFELFAPKKGEMIRTIEESICSKIHLILKENEKVIFEDTSINCGLEIAL